MKQKTLRELVVKKQIFAPIVWDVWSAKAAEIAGFEATLLSGGIVASNCATPDIGIITSDDLVRITTDVCTASPLPCCIDADNGFGETPLHAYHTTRRLVEAGAMSLTLDDTTGFRGYSRWGVELREGKPLGSILHPVVPRDVFLAKTRAALDACTGTDCMLIARTECALQEGLDEAIERCVRAEEFGAEMTLIIGLTTLEQAKYVAKNVKNWKMWPDVMAPGSVPDVSMDDLANLGFNYVTAHVLQKGANYRMIDVGRRTLMDRNTVYADNDPLGMTESEVQAMRKDEIADQWFCREEKYWQGLENPYLGKM
jgi:2-methylisocitrate lyase-like PEP mutase family enzyme